MWFLSCCALDIGQKEQTSIGPASPASLPAAGGATPSTEVKGAEASPQAAKLTEDEPAKDVPPGPPLVSTVGPLPVLKGRSSDQLDTCDAASVRSGASHKYSNRSGMSNASSVGTEFINEHIPAHKREVARIQSQMKSFVKGMLKGREMSVLSVDGQLRSCTCSFDRKLKVYSIVISKETRKIPLSKFSEVFQGKEPDDIDTPLDELCCTFVLDSGECLTFRFKTVEERESFAMCLQIIVDGHQ